MFEIGNSLREARLRQGLELPRIENETKIRGKYLSALEEETFDVVPGHAYVKGFLRTYAEYLGLDGQLYVDEFNSRFAAAEEPSSPPPARRPRPRARAVESNLVIVALAGIVAVTVLVVVAWKFGTGTQPAAELLVEQDATAPAETAPAGAQTPSATAPAPPATTETATPAPRAKLVVSATEGDCWLRVRAGSATGELLYEGTLEQGQTQRFAKWRRLWLEIGAPSNLSVRLNGRSLDGFPTQQSIVVVTAKGVRTVSTT